MSTRIVKHGSDPELATMVDLDVTVLSANTAAISGDSELIEILANWAAGIGWGSVRFDIETDDLALRDCRAVKSEGRRVTVVHFMARD